MTEKGERKLLVGQQYGDFVLLDCRRHADGGDYCAAVKIDREILAELDAAHEKTAQKIREERG